MRSNEWGRAKIAAVAGSGLVFAGIAFAYWWHQSDVFSSIDSANWYTNGTVNGSGIGLVGTGGSVISKVAVPYTPNDYEVKAKVKLAGAGGGDYVLYARASTNAQSPSTGQYYTAEWLAPSCNGSGSCSGWMSIYKKLSAGSHTQLAFVMATTTNWTAEIRFQALGTGLYVWMNGVMILNATDSGIATGAPGVGVRSTPSGCALERVDIGHRDNGAPTAPSLTVSRFPQNIRVRWQAPTDPSTIPEDAGTGSGVAQYHVWKNGIYQGSFANGSAPGTWVEWVDTAATDPTQTYTYQIGAADYHFNTTYAPTVTVQPSAVITSYDARQVGVKTLGTYWGAGGENIDLRSGNLNYTLPLVQAQMRGGGGVTVGLTYNSQVWTKQGNVEWRVGDDVGFGFGWKVLIGSVAPVYENNAIKHYVFADSSGSEYKLDQNASGKWTSKEGIYVTYDTNFSPHRLYFNSGVFWEMGSQSGGIEEDAGARYPTKIQDTNGNQLKVLYNSGVGGSGDNTSARIATIEDVRAIQYAANDWRTYTFNYATGVGDTFPHLSSVANHINSGETYTMTYWPGSGSNGFPMTSPFTGVTDWRNVRLLWIVTMPERNNMTYTMGNANTGELTSVTQPYGGVLEWDHSTFGYASNYSIRQVSTRRAKPNATTTWSYGFFHDTVGTTANVVHGWTEVQDAGNATRTRYEFETNTVPVERTGLMKLKRVKDHPSGTPKIEETPTWSTSPSGNPYISAVVTQQDPGQAYVKTGKTEQDVDLYGNMTAQRVFDFGGSTPGLLRKTYTNTYVTASNYVNAYMRNRMLTSNDHRGWGDGARFDFGLRQLLGGEHDRAETGPERSEPGGRARAAAA